MKINQNISAVIVNDQLLRNENKLAQSTKRLSSGVRFNNAKDNPSGVAISYRMQAQIDALGRASANATDGTSMVQTIDSAMGEMNEVLQRMRELCVQAASDTNTPEDKEAVQKEIRALKEEINRISTDTEFNGKKLMDGTLDRRTYVTSKQATVGGTAVTDKTSMFDTISNVIISDEVQAGNYQIAITAPAEHAAAQGAAGTGGNALTQSGIVCINGVEAELKEGMTPEEVYQALRDAGNEAWVNVFPTDGTGQQAPITEETLDTQGYIENQNGYQGFNTILAFVSQDYGSQAKVEVTCSNPALAAQIGIPANCSGVGKDAEVDVTDPDIAKDYSGQVTTKVSGNEITITDKSGFEISFEARADVNNAVINIEATDIGTLQLQIGANEDQELAVRVPVLNTTSLYIDDLDVTKQGGGDRGIAQADTAIRIVSAARSKIGAYENRLDYAKSGLDATEEDMTNAISNLADVDMAEEMTTYTNSTVLTQASISVLAQANDLPQQVLSLLQG